MANWYLAVLFLLVKKYKKEGSRAAGRADRLPVLVKNVISASGSTSVGMQEESFDLDYIETKLEIEEEGFCHPARMRRSGRNRYAKLTRQYRSGPPEGWNRAKQAALDYRQQLLDSERGKNSIKRASAAAQPREYASTALMRESLQGICG